METASLLTAAATIRDETTDYQNTALRVGTLFASIVTAFTTLETELKASAKTDSDDIHAKLQALRNDLTAAQAAILQNLQSIKNGEAAQQEAKKEAEALAAKLQTLREDHESLVDDVAVNCGDIEKNSKDLAQNAKDIARNADDISSLRSTAQDLSDDLATAETDIRQLSADLRRAETEIEALKKTGGSSATLPDGLDLTQLVADVEMLKGRMTV